MTNNVNKGKIIIFRGQSQYNVLTLACDIMAKGFEENGYKTLILDLTEERPKKVIIDIINREMAENGLFIFSFNAGFHDVSINNNNISLVDFLNYPVYAFLVDYPYYHDDRLAFTKSDKVHIGCVDYNHISYINQFYPNISHTHFIPHFSFQADEIIPLESRSINLFFPGSYESSNIRMESIEELPSVYCGIAKEIIKRILKDINLTIEEALKAYFLSINFVYTNDEFKEIIQEIILVDHYIRSYYREKIVVTILEAGIKLTVCGKGWDELKKIYGDLLVILGTDGLDVSDNVKLIAQSKMLLNVLPSFKNGTHERVFTAMFNKSICLTNPNKYFEQKFKDNEEIVYYTLNHLENLPKIIEQTLNNPDKMKYITDNAYNRAINEFTPKQIAKYVLEEMNIEE